MSDLIKISSHSTRFEAELVSSLLKENGIKSLISSDGSGFSHISLFNGPSQVLVRQEDKQKAQEILASNSSNVGQT
ncbi:MAG: DUF2007 domain-containing protein [Patescibacteria group bacterium]